MPQERIEISKENYRDQLVSKLNDAFNTNDGATFLTVLRDINKPKSHPTGNSTHGKVQEHHYITQKEPYLSEKELHNLFKVVKERNDKPAILEAFYQHEMQINQPAFDVFRSKQQASFFKNDSDMQLEFAVLTNNTKLAGMILAGSPDYMQNKQLFERLEKVTPIMNNLAQLEEIHKKSPSQELSPVMMGMQYHVKQFITGQTTPQQFITQASKTVDASKVNLQKHSDVWTILKNIVSALMHIGENRPIFENSTTSKVREMKEKLQSIKSENTTSSNKVVEKEEINPDFTSMKPS